MEDLGIFGLLIWPMLAVVILAGIAEKIMAKLDKERNDEEV